MPTACGLHPVCTKRTFIVLFCWTWTLFCTLSTSQAREVPIRELQPYISNGGYALQVGDQIVRSDNLDKSYIPASTIKVLTSLMAIEILGPDYRFATQLSVDDSGTLYIRGEGDPFLTSEGVVSMAQQVKKAGISRIESIVLDDSAFSLEGPPPDSANTSNPYDAHSGALAVNFNALPFAVTSSHTVLSGEPQTPLLPIMKDIGGRFSKGSYRVNVSAYSQAKDHSNILRYAGELITAIFRDQGISVTNGYRSGSVPETARPLLVFESENNVADLVRLCLHYSSNFIANQLFLSCGRRIHGFPATWEKARRAAREFIDLRLGLAQGAIRMEDGSGLSSGNRISPSEMLVVLNRFAPYAGLMRRQRDAYVKSGTLTGVYSYVGYFQSDGQYAPFVLFLNQMRNNRKKMLRLMEREYLINFQGLERHENIASD